MRALAAQGARVKQTERVYRRYAIVSDAELQEASRKTDGHTFGHIGAG